jgi:3-oxoacyl-[acyl-carrier protein] reductase
MEKSEKTALVTGASRGIGRAIALTLGQAGYAVAVNYAGSEAAAEAVKNEIIAAGGKAFTLQGDVSDPEDVKHMFEKIKEGFGFLDVLVNNAGITRDSLLIRMKESSFKHFGAFHMYVNTIRINGAVRHRFSHTAGWDI